MSPFRLKSNLSLLNIWPLSGFYSGGRSFENFPWSCSICKVRLPRPLNLLPNLTNFIPVAQALFSRQNQERVLIHRAYRESLAPTSPPPGVLSAEVKKPKLQTDHFHVVLMSRMVELHPCLPMWSWHGDSLLSTKAIVLSASHSVLL